MPFYDAHSHLFVVAEGVGKDDPAGGRPVQGRLIGRLSDMQAAGVQKMVISGKVDPTETHRSADSWDLNRAVARAVEREQWGGTNYFVPLANLMTEIDSGTGDSEVRWDDYPAVEDFLAQGFKGVGELLVHGHNTNQADNYVLLELAMTAARHGVPIAFHWDFGTVDDASPTNAQENFDQLVSLLDSLDEALARMPAGANHLDVVICHCGAGPYGASLSDLDGPPYDDLLAAYIENMDSLFARDTTWTKVHFDLAGMQVGDGRSTTTTKHTNAVEQLFSIDDGLTTPLGDLILELIAAWPDRFMVGLDMDPQPSQRGDFHYAVAAMEISVRIYKAFLELLGDESAAEAVLYTNAEALFGS